MLLDPEILAGMVVDITDSLPDLAQEDRVFRSASGYVVKVKCVLSRADGWAGGHVAHVNLSGSICGADGKALPRRDGSLSVWDLKQSHVFKADGDDDPAAALQVSRLRCVAATIRAEKARQTLTDHTEGAVAGLVTAEQFQRKRQEATS